MMRTEGSLSVTYVTDVDRTVSVNVVEAFKDELTSHAVEIRLTHRVLRDSRCPYSRHHSVSSLPVRVKEIRLCTTAT